MKERFQNFICGTWADAVNGTTFEDSNPANRVDILGSFPRSDHRDVDRAVEEAKASYARWRREPAARRAEILFRTGELMGRRKEELALLITRETGKLLRESRDEVQQAIDTIYFVAGEGRRLYGAIAPLELPDRFSITVRRPLGVVGVMTPWNFPLAIPVRKLTPALVAGNTVIFKPAKDAPLAAVRLLEILLEAGLPPGAVSLVHGYGEEAGAPLVRHPDVSLISFTGTAEVGREVAIACAAEHKRVSLELGGSNALLVMEDADMALALDGAIPSAFASSGRGFTATSCILVHQQVAREFTDGFVGRARGLRVGDGQSSETNVGPVISEGQLKRVHGYTRLGIREGARLLCGGEIYREGECKKGFFYAPTVFGEVTRKMRIYQEEIPGPSVAIVTVDNLEEAVEVANTGRYRLAATLISRDIKRAFRAVEGLVAGVVSVNAPPGASEVHLPPGGMRHGGSGSHEGGWRLLDAFTEWKTISIGNV